MPECKAMDGGSENWDNPSPMTMVNQNDDGFPVPSVLDPISDERTARQLAPGQGPHRENTPGLEPRTAPPLFARNPEEALRESNSKSPCRVR